MINKEEVLYGKLAVLSGFIDEDQFRQAVEEKRVCVEEAQSSGNGKSKAVPNLDKILKKRGLIDHQQDAFIREKLAVRTPKTLAGYEIVKKLGQGAMGAVYKARQVSMDREVALKVLSRDLKRNKTFVARFEREAHIVGKLNHRNIVAGIDSGIEDGIYYYVMEYVEGRSLDDMLEKDGKLPRETALDYALQMARALEHAHEHGMVHRDVKPENILISNEGVAKLCDMGLAKPENDNANLTQVGTSMGTPHYISPEQARGQEADIRSDIYSLGASLWNSIFGDVPFRAETPALVLAAHIDDPLPDPKTLDPTLPNSVCRLLKKMLAKSVDERQQNPTVLREELEAIVEGRADERPTSTKSGRRRSARRPKNGKNNVKGTGKNKKKAGAKTGPKKRASGAHPRATRPRPQRKPTENNSKNGLIIGVVLGVLALAALAFAFSGNNPDETGDADQHVERKQPTAAGSGSSTAVDGNEARLARLASQLDEIDKLAIDPQAFQQAIKRYDALRGQYTEVPRALAMIDRKRDRVVTRAEAAGRKARMEIDADVTRALGAGKKGEALDTLTTYPPYLEFTEAGQQVVAQRKQLDAELDTALTALLKAAGELASDGKLDEAITTLTEAKPTFDAARRETIAATIGELTTARDKALAAAMRKLSADFSRLISEIEPVIAKRDYLDAQQKLAPLVTRWKALPTAMQSDAALSGLRDMDWDVARLVRLQAAHDAKGGAEPEKATAEQYLSYAVKAKDEIGKEYSLLVAVFHFHEKRYLDADKALKLAKAAEVDCGTLPERLTPKLPGALEAAAAAAFAELEKRHAAKSWDELEQGIAAFKAAFAQSKLYAEKKATLEAWIALIAASRIKDKPKEDPKWVLDKLLHGKIHKWDPKTRKLDIEYYFKTDAELKDWKIVALPGQMARFVKAKMELDPKVKGWVTGSAPAGYDHVVVWERGLVVSCKYRSTDPLISGIALMADGMTKRYAFGFDMRNPFGGGGGGRGGRGGRGGGGFPRHKAYIAKYNGDWRNPKFLHTFGQAPKPNQVYSIICEVRNKKRGNGLSMTFNGRRVLAAKDDALTSGRVSLFSFRNASYARVRMKGTVQVGWLENFVKSGGKNTGDAGSRGDGGGGRGDGSGSGRRGGGRRGDGGGSGDGEKKDDDK